MHVSGLRTPAIVATGVVLLGGALLLSPDVVDARGKGAAAGLTNVEGASVGQVKFVPRDDGKVTVKVNAKGLEPGWHGIHIHTTGVCEPDATDDGGNASPFFTAGTHWNPEETDHGTHPGDIPPLYAGEDGVAKSFFVTGRFKVKDLLDEDGSAVILHAGPDNLAHIPAESTSGGRPVQVVQRDGPELHVRPGHRDVGDRRRGRTFRLRGRRQRLISEGAGNGPLFMSSGKTFPLEVHAVG